ncbi:MAG TPA: RsmD family RNA methyltransferase [Burkholderiaceae bacterium]|nr:RsmD family RNA methyltransferase [Burkholderiaceae bacterium]
MLVGALGYFVDIFDLLIFPVTSMPSLTELGVTDARVVGGSLPGTLREGAPYDVIFMDPPWRKGLELPVATRLIATGRLGPGTLLVVEAAHRDSWDESAWLRARLELTDSRAYGDTEMRFFRAHGTTPE